MSRAPRLLHKGGAPAENRAADAFLARETGKKWRWPRVQGVQLADDVDAVATGDPDPLALLLALEEASARLSRGAVTEQASTSMDVKAAAARAHRCARSVQLVMKKRVEEEAAGQLPLPCFASACEVYKTRRGGGRKDVQNAKRGAA